jgi:hypothetical protein
MTSKEGPPPPLAGLPRAVPSGREVSFTPSIRQIGSFCPMRLKRSETGALLSMSTGKLPTRTFSEITTLLISASSTAARKGCTQKDSWPNTRLGTKRLSGDATEQGPPYRPAACQRLTLSAEPPSRMDLSKFFGGKISSGRAAFPLVSPRDVAGRSTTLPFADARRLPRGAAGSASTTRSKACRRDGGSGSALAM